MPEHTEIERAALIHDYAAFWWAQESGETETWEELHADEREAVIENSYAEHVADWLAQRKAPDGRKADELDSLGGPWTRHGHAVPGVTTAGTGRGPIARCGGPKICRECAADAEFLLSPDRLYRPAGACSCPPDECHDAGADGCHFGAAIPSNRPGNSEAGGGRG